VLELDRRAVDADQMAVRPDDVGCVLQPRSRRTTEVEDAIASVKDAVFLVDLRELENRARAKARPLGLRVKGVAAVLSIAQLGDRASLLVRLAGPRSALPAR